MMVFLEGRGYFNINRAFTKTPIQRLNRVILSLPHTSSFSS